MAELSPETLQILLGGIIALAAGAVIYLLANPYLSGEVARDKRIQGVTTSRSKRSAVRQREEEAQSRRKAVADTLKEIEDRQKETKKVSLRMRLQRAGLDISTNAFWVASGIVGVVVAGGSVLANPTMHPLIYPAAGFIGAMGLPSWIVKFLTKRRQAKFTSEFANAIDVIVRGVKSGLPLNECLGIIARESPSPLREEFAELVDQTRVGVPLQDCFERMMNRMPLAEVKFFAIVIGIQQQAGGNLSEALGNLSGVLRDRKRLAMKVKAMSSEAKASAAVLGALPFIVMSMVYLSTPNYIMLLFTTKMGQLMIMGAAVWMTLGILMMRKMINFKF
ncbi:MAG: type II secretion system F family protein [Hyphomicrobiaceae bacterium]